MSLWRIPNKELRKCSGILLALVPGQVHSEGHVHPEHFCAISPAEPTDSSYCSESDVDASPARLNVDSNVDVDASSIDLDLNVNVIRGIIDAAPVLPDDFEKLRKDAIANLLRLYVNCWKPKCNPSQHKYLQKQTNYLMRAIRSVEPNGKPFPIFLLLCSTPECLGGVDSSCGGSYNRDHDYSACRSVIAMKNIISWLGHEHCAVGQ